MTRRKLFYKLPPSLRFAVRRLYYLPTDILWRLQNPDKLKPPVGLIYTGAGNFLALGNKILLLMQKFGLQPSHNFIDVGSGIGRVALPLTTFLNKDAQYHGFDVIQLGVNWCQKNIHKKYNNFSFLYTPIYNDLYRNDGTKAEEFIFPYQANYFNYGIANSLFTHMMPNEVAHYYNELYKVMAIGGKFYATFFLVSASNKEKYTSNPNFQFLIDKGDFKLMDEKVTSANIAFDEDYLFNKIIDPLKFKIIYKQYGYWHNEALAATCDEYQDIVVVEKIG